MNMTEFALNTTLVTLQVICLPLICCLLFSQSLQINATGGVFEDDLDTAVDNLLALLLTSATTAGAIPALLNGVIAGPMRKSINNAYATMRSTSTSANSCPVAQPVEQPFNSMTAVAPLTGVVVVIGIVFLALFHRTIRGKKERHDDVKWTVLDGPLNSDSESSALLSVARRDKTPALIHATELPSLLRHGMLIMLWFANPALAIDSNSNAFFQAQCCAADLLKH